EIIAALDKIRDSYNVNGLGQIAAVATLTDLAFYRNNFRRIKATRERLGRDLSELGFTTCPSQANFLFVQPPKFAANVWLGKLRAQKILVRWFGYPATKNFLRITIGTDPEADALLRAVRKILS
ncbi:MAG: aminotransferase class I/II-fold pyridoxal phosphate-dependent enzyme, partial [Verrucomicrobiota bacterium]